MASRSDSTWRIMQDNKYVLIGEVSKDMICLICRKLMINASYGPCGCRYCNTCIISYLQGNDKPCPGNSNDCFKKAINFNCDIRIDNAQNLLIRKLIVKCPQANCDVTNELRYMEDHLKECNLNTDNMVEYLSGINIFSTVNHEESGTHSRSKFLLESFDNLKNENETLKKDLSQFKSEVETNRNLYIVKINELERLGQINALKMEEVNQEMETVKNDNIRLKEEMENLKNTNEIDTMKQQIERMEVILSQQTIELNQLKENFNFSDNTKIGNKDEINPSYFQTNNLEISEYTHNEISEINQFEENPEITIKYGPFEWKIENISKYESNKWINSEPYFTHENGYKFCLWVKYNISKLDSGLSFMQGEFDNDLSWPFKHGFTVEVVNSYYRKTITYKNDPENVGWKRPLGSYCSIITFYCNISLHHSFIDNDCMTIRCFVDL